MDCHSSHRGNCKRLSAPIMKTKFISRCRRRSVFNKSTVYCVRYLSSTSDTCIFGGSGKLRTVFARLSQLGCSGLSGFCGLTSHQISSSPSCRSPARATWRCPPCAGLNDPPNRPTDFPAALKVEPVPCRGPDIYRLSNAERQQGRAREAVP